MRVAELSMDALVAQDHDATFEAGVDFAILQVTPRFADARWRTDTHWFDVAVVTSTLMLGHLFFGRFVEHQSRWRRLIKSLVGIAVLVVAAVFAGRGWMYALLGAILVGVLAVHGWWLPRNGVNGWTAEPRQRYYELLGLDSDGSRRERETR